MSEAARNTAADVSQRDDALPRLPARTIDGHKGTFGTVLVVGGCAAPPRTMVGGPAFAALAALRSGAGLAILAMPTPLLVAGLTIAPSATGVALPVTELGELRPAAVAEALDALGSAPRCIALGPGLGRGPAPEQVTLRLVARDSVPLVIDADALNALAATPEFAGDLQAPAVLTPHPGEYRRLASALGLRCDPEDPSRRTEAAEALARRLGCVVVLKGRGTVVSDGITSWTNRSGNAALGTAGTGDVLTGIVASFIAQFARRGGSTPDGDGRPSRHPPLSLFDCARLAVAAHALAADRWAARRGAAGVLAAELADELPETIEAMRGA
ncbi:MAG TPA: NAD(P)H-hydrate dehydratase [Phycisphaerales bacterium]|nr:NAD(P)H-hydrate dehydratase [Phycisphaerales bacterium]HMP36450.1 NAD(P)H-hydrate dehydratase [Phycisphaerales bacterium]